MVVFTFVQVGFVVFILVVSVLVVGEGGMARLFFSIEFSKGNVALATTSCYVR